MLTLNRQAISARLARSTVRYLSLGAQCDASSVSASSKAPDPHLEMRRAERLAREAKLPEVKLKGLPNQGRTRNFTSSPPKPNITPPRKVSMQDRPRSRSSGPTRRAGRLRQAASQPGAAEAISAFTRRDASEHPKRSIAPTLSKDDMALEKPELPSLVAPEPIVTNVKALLNNVPNLTSSLPRLLPPTVLREAPAAWVEQVYGGDYSQWQLDFQSYLKGARGPRSTYAEIILNRNSTVSPKSQKVLIAAIRRATKET